MNERTRQLIRRTSKRLDFDTLLSGDFRANYYETGEILREASMLFTALAQPAHSTSEEQANLSAAQDEDDKIVMRHYLSEVVRVFGCEDILKEPWNERE